MGNVRESIIAIGESGDARLRISSGSGDFAVAEVAGPEDCPECDGTGHEVVERQGAVAVRPCGCGLARRACARFNAARIPRRMAGKTFENFHPPEGQYALASVEGFVRMYGGRDGSLGFVLMGPVGTGKSHLLVAALRVFTLELGVSCRYVEFFHLLSELKAGYSSGKSEMEIISPLCSVDVLAVDELGKGRGSDWEMYVLDEIISRRYNADKVTLFGTNYTDERKTSLPSRLPAAGSGYVRTRGRDFAEEVAAETLEERVGARIYSRLHEMCDFIECGGPDYRKRRSADGLRIE